MRNKVLLVGMVVAAFVVMFAMMVPAGWGTEYQSMRANILCFGAIGLIFLPGRHVMKGGGLVMFLLVGCFAYALLTGAVGLAPPDVNSGAYSFADGWVLAALTFALMASFWRSLGSDGEAQPLLLRATSLNFVAWALVPYFMTAAASGKL